MPPWQAGPTLFRYRFEGATAFDPAASTRFGRTARLAAQASEILPLDRFAPTGSTSYREGALGLIGSDVGVDGSGDTESTGRCGRARTRPG